MSARAKKWIEIVKSILIAALMLSMTILFLLTWSTDSESLPPSVRRVVDGVGRFFGGKEQYVPEVVGSRAETYGDAVLPASIAINDGGGLRTLAADASVDEAYARLRPVIAECLGSAGQPSRLSGAAFNDILRSSDGVFVGYTGSLRLRLLALGHGVVCPSAGDLSVDRIFLCVDGEVLTLYTASDGEYCSFETTASAAGLDVFGDSASLRRADWSFDLGFDAAGTAVYPAGVLRLPSAAVSGVAVGESMVQTLLSAFSMNPETNYRYTSADGTQYAVEDTRVLAAGTNGAIFYANSSRSIPPRSARTDDAVVEYCRALAAAATQSALGDARLTFRSLEHREDGLTEVHFGFTLGGMPVCIEGSQDAAVFLLHGDLLKEAHILLRRCTLNEDALLMMPPSSAAAIGASGLCYYDDREPGSLLPEWSR